ncbi:hypothetical protein BEN30_15055 [Magnetovibrio blakemorei]|uniref:Uncharacterized protein n=2 Tax=Magnetovibrio blakemorei TaxID=28181 RepID=A0A1E5Q5L3_9PROT|nr:hypothetical protein BEN30_15055 [Magnetovibrio blakemorei]
MTKMVIENCEQAKNDATIAAFVKLFETDAVDGVLDFRTLQEPRYMPFWKSFYITQLVEGGHIRFVYFGTSLVDGYGKELTGQIATVEEFGAAYETLRKINLRVIEDKTIQYTSGSLDWLDKDFRNWHRVNVPLLKNHETHCLSVIIFE